MTVDVRGIGIHVASLVWVALRSFVGTMLVLMLAGVILAGLSYYFVSEDGWLYCTPRGLTAWPVENGGGGG